MPITVDLEKIPLMRAAIERVRAKAEREISIDLTLRALRARFPGQVPADLPDRLDGLATDDLKDLLNRSMIAAAIDDVLVEVDRCTEISP
jgi:hypothetical protein